LQGGPGPLLAPFLPRLFVGYFWVKMSGFLIKKNKPKGPDGLLQPTMYCLLFFFVCFKVTHALLLENRKQITSPEPEPGLFLSQA